MVIAELLVQRIWDESLKYCVNKRELFNRSHDRDSLYRVKDEGDPGVVVGVFEAPKRLSERKIADDIKGSPIEPLRHVDVTLCRILCQLIHKDIDMLSNQWLLLPDSFIGEGKGEHTALS